VRNLFNEENTMSHSFRLLLSLSLFILALTGMPSPAQVPTGAPPFGSFGGGPDTINLANLNVHWDI
jgi:hypothetical protein